MTSQASGATRQWSSDRLSHNLLGLVSWFTFPCVMASNHSGVWAAKCHPLSVLAMASKELERERVTRPQGTGTCWARYPLVNKGHNTRALRAYLGHRHIEHTVRYTELAPE